MRCPFFVVPVVLMPLIGCGQQNSEDLAIDNVAQRSSNSVSSQPDRLDETDAAAETASVADPIQSADAELILSESLALAKQDDKRLLVHLGVPG